jgi:hypothetical protein
LVCHVRGRRRLVNEKQRTEKNSELRKWKKNDTKNCVRLSYTICIAVPGNRELSECR